MKSGRELQLGGRMLAQDARSLVVLTSAWQFSADFGPCPQEYDTHALCSQLKRAAAFPSPCDPIWESFSLGNAGYCLSSILSPTCQGPHKNETHG